MMDFDLLDDAEEILQPLCLCLNQDSSRVGVGHHKGYVIYRIHRSVSSSAISSEEEAANRNTNTTTSSVSRPPFCTTVEAVFPPRREIELSSQATTWDAHERTPTLRTVASSDWGTSRGNRGDDVDNDALLSLFAHSPPPSQRSVRAAEQQQQQRKMEEEKINLNSDAAGKVMKDDVLGAEIVSTRADVLPAEIPTTALASAYMEPSASRWTKDEKAMPLPTECGIGVMALLYKTQFVAVVGGGPYPVGPRNVVKIFVTGDVWPDRSLHLPDPVKDLRLDHRVIITLTTREVRLYSFETDQCLLALPLWTDAAPLAGPLGGNTSAFTANLPAPSKNMLPLTGSVPPGAKSNASVTYVDAPLAIDYNKKCLVFRRSLLGFSLLRYDAESSLSSSHVHAKLLATVPVAHEHTLSSLAMDLNGNMMSSSSSSNGSNTLSRPMRWHVATCSERATVIRVWRYCEGIENSATTTTIKRTSAAGGATDSHSQNRMGSGNLEGDYGSEKGLPGYFVKVREVRNASFPTPIFQLRFLGEAFLFCIAGNTLKIFYVGEEHETKPYDVSTRDPSKVSYVQNYHSSLYHLGLVSSYFNSEWAACECPLPLTDDVFVPRWIYTTTGTLRQHLFRDMSSSQHPVDFSDAPAQESGSKHVKSSGSLSHSQPSGSQNLLKTLQNDKSSSYPTSLTKSQDFGSMFRRYVSQQMAPFVEGAGRVARLYWGSSSGGSETAQNLESEGTDSGAEKRDYATLTELAQSLVVWWEQPTYWQVEYMTRWLPHTGSNMTGEILPFRPKSPRLTALYGVTCDGSTISFEFDPVGGTIRCSKAVQVSSSEA